MPRFVILEHQWNGVHWDFMLEYQGVLETWAVTSPIQADLSVPARRLLNHRLAYLDYEGDISEGRGSVIRIDRGGFKVVDWTDDRIEVTLWGATYYGSIELQREVAQSEGDSTGTCWSIRFEERRFD